MKWKRIDTIQLILEIIEIYPQGIRISSDDIDVYSEYFAVLLQLFAIFLHFEIFVCFVWTWQKYP